MNRRPDPLPVSQAGQKAVVREFLEKTMESQMGFLFDGEREKAAHALASSILRDVMSVLPSFMESKLIGERRSFAKPYAPSGKWRLIRFTENAASGKSKGGILCLPAQLFPSDPGIDAESLEAGLTLFKRLMKEWPNLPAGREMQAFSEIL